jgi:hypothetical protein
VLSFHGIAMAFWSRPIARQASCLHYSILFCTLQDGILYKVYKYFLFIKEILCIVPTLFIDKLLTNTFSCDILNMLWCKKAGASGVPLWVHGLRLLLLDQIP